MDKEYPNLTRDKPFTAGKASELGKLGAARSIEVRRQKKYMTEAYLKAMGRKYEIEIDGKPRHVTWPEYVGEIVADIMARRDSVTVSLMAEIRKTLEGDLVTAAGSLDIKSLSAMSREEKEAVVKEILAKAASAKRK